MPRLIAAAKALSLPVSSADFVPNDAGCITHGVDASAGAPELPVSEQAA
jgi:hypothetical protein